MGAGCGCEQRDGEEQIVVEPDLQGLPPHGVFGENPEDFLTPRGGHYESWECPEEASQRRRTHVVDANFKKDFAVYGKRTRSPQVLRVMPLTIELYDGQIGFEERNTLVVQFNRAELGSFGYTHASFRMSCVPITVGQTLPEHRRVFNFKTIDGKEIADAIRDSAVGIDTRTFNNAFHSGKKTGDSDKKAQAAVSKSTPTQAENNTSE